MGPSKVFEIIWNGSVEVADCGATPDHPDAPAPHSRADHVAASGFPESDAGLVVPVRVGLRASLSQCFCTGMQASLLLMRREMLEVAIQLGDERFAQTAFRKEIFQSKGAQPIDMRIIQTAPNYGTPSHFGKHIH